MDSPDQGAKGIPTESVTIKDDSIIVKVPAIMGSYRRKNIYRQYEDRRQMETRRNES